MIAPSAPGPSALPSPWQTTKWALAGAFYYSGLLAAWQRAHRSLGSPCVHVLAYHRIVPDFDAAAAKAIPALCTSTDLFDTQLRYVRQHMCVLDLATAVDVLRGRFPVDRDVCVITLDDGYRDTYTQAFPILRALDLPATVFVPTGYVDTQKQLPHDRLYAALRTAVAQPARAQARRVPAYAEIWALRARRRGTQAAVEQAAASLPGAQLRMVIDALTSAYGAPEPCDGDGLVLTWAMCKEMAEAGIEIGAHSVSHAPLAHEAPDSLLHEVRDSKAAIEHHLGRSARFFAYPNGSYSKEAMRACRQVGFLGGLTTEARRNRVGTDPMRIGRKVLWQAHGRAPDGRSSRALVASHLENVHGDLQERLRDLLRAAQEATLQKERLWPPA